MRKINICIPASGLGSRFLNAGYQDPKPFIKINNKFMIEYVIDNMKIPNRELNFILYFRKEHYEKYGEELQKKLFFITSKNNLITFNFVEIDKVTEGSACTVLKARNLINNQDELIITNSDQYLDWNKEDFINMIDVYNPDGSIITFDGKDDPKWSFSKVNDGYITQVREKEVISQFCNTGVFYFKYGKSFVESSENMILNDERINNEFYVSPVYNYLINKLGHKIMNYYINSFCFHGLGTPEDLEKFIKNLLKIY
jgi:NDP-sugar pyrophosphorylase family protein